MEGLLFQESPVLVEALLEQLALVPELDDGLRVGVERGDGGRHAAGEGSPSQAVGEEGGASFPGSAGCREASATPASDTHHSHGAGL